MPSAARNHPDPASVVKTVPLWYGFRPSGAVPTPMLKISRLTDYGLLAAVYLARHAGVVTSAREIAEFYHLPVPAVTKVLKTLNHSGLVKSHRGVDGGYS